MKSAVPSTTVFANTGVRLSNVADMLSVADGAIIGTAFKREGSIWNEVEERHVGELMAQVKIVREKDIN